MSVSLDLYQGLEVSPAAKAEAKAAEFYPTPASAVRSLIDAGILPLDGPFLEPFAGDGAIIRAIPEVKEWWALEIRKRGLGAIMEAVGEPGDLLVSEVRRHIWCPCDFFRDPGVKDWIQTIEPRVVVTNPPNSRAFDAVRLLREWCPEAWIAFLQPVGFGGGKSRMDWFAVNMPDCYRLAERPDFSGNGSGGLQDYAWWVWPPEGVIHPYPRATGEYRVLPPSGWKPSTQGVLL